MFGPDPEALPCRGLPFANCDTRFDHTVVDHTSLLATGLHYTKLDATPGQGGIASSYAPLSHLTAARAFSLVPGLLFSLSSSVKTISGTKTTFPSPASSAILSARASWCIRIFVSSTTASVPASSRSLRVATSLAGVRPDDQALLTFLANCPSLFSLLDADALYFSNMPLLRRFCRSPHQPARYRAALHQAGRNTWPGPLPVPPV